MLRLRTSQVNQREHLTQSKENTLDYTLPIVQNTFAELDACTDTVNIADIGI